MITAYEITAEFFKFFWKRFNLLGKVIFLPILSPLIIVGGITVLLVELIFLNGPEFVTKAFKFLFINHNKGSED